MSDMFVAPEIPIPEPAGGRPMFCDGLLHHFSFSKWKKRNQQRKGEREKTIQRWIYDVSVVQGHSAAAAARERVRGPAVAVAGRGVWPAWPRLVRLASRRLTGAGAGSSAGSSTTAFGSAATGDAGRGDDDHVRPRVPWLVVVVVVGRYRGGGATRVGWRRRGWRATREAKMRARRAMPPGRRRTLGCRLADAGND